MGIWQIDDPQINDSATVEAQNPLGAIEVYMAELRNATGDYSVECGERKIHLRLTNEYGYTELVEVSGRAETKYYYTMDWIGE